MAGKRTVAEQARPVNANGFDYLTPEERFLLFVVPAAGSARAAKCLTLNPDAAEEMWREFSLDPLPVNLRSTP